jgi:hypothetical protein
MEEKVTFSARPDPPAMATRMVTILHFPHLAGQAGSTIPPPRGGGTEQPSRAGAGSGISNIQPIRSLFLREV